MVENPGKIVESSSLGEGKTSNKFIIMMIMFYHYQYHYYRYYCHYDCHYYCHYYCHVHYVAWYVCVCVRACHPNLYMEIVHMNNTKPHFLTE